MSIPQDYAERVYAGVLGKIIGVYLGRPFEGWSYDNILEKLGPINYYVHEKLDVPLIVTDDDISGTFTFLRALPDYGNSRDLTPAQIGQTWLNYIIKERTILWWGGLGNSTEHTAFLRLSQGIKAPRSGSIEMNGQVVAEQIGSQIFIDGWAMVAPGDPELAADLARRAGSVSHDGEALYGAQVIAALEAQAFVESNIHSLIDTAVALIPQDSVIYRLISDIREWHAQELDWEQGREKIQANYGYDKYGGNCHMVPNHGLIIHALLHGADDFQKSLMIVNTCGWDTDCNSGNVGCLMGIKNGLTGINIGPDWRGPIADRLYLPTADGGRAITDAATEAYHIVNIGRALAGQETITPKNGAKYHFELPGSVQGFQVEGSIEVKGTLSLENVTGHSQQGTHSLALRYQGLAPGRVARAATGTFILSADIAAYFDKRGYSLLASPTLYAGQTVRANLSADQTNEQSVTCCLYIRVYDEKDDLMIKRSSPVTLAPGATHDFAWQLEDTAGLPIAEVGVEISSSQSAAGSLYLDYLTWDGTPQLKLTCPETMERRNRWGQMPMWQRAWVNGVDVYHPYWPEPYRLVQNEGRGLIIQGTRDWTDYQVSADVTPHLVTAAGVGARVQGMKRYYALLLCQTETGPKARLVKALDGDTILAEADFDWQFGQTYQLTLAVEGSGLRATIDGQAILDVEDSQDVLTGGGIALLCEEGRTATQVVAVGPVS